MNELAIPVRHGRANDELRPVEIVPHYIPYAEGSALIMLGNTHVLCAATVEERVPSFLVGSGQGWITAEYGMLPRSGRERIPPGAHGSWREDGGDSASHRPVFTGGCGPGSAR